MPLKKGKEEISYSFSSKVCLDAYIDLSPKMYLLPIIFLITVFHVNIMVYIKFVKISHFDFHATLAWALFFYCITQIAGGTGITPMLQVIEAILRNPDDKTQVGNKPLLCFPPRYSFPFSTLLLIMLSNSEVWIVLVLIYSNCLGYVLSFCLLCIPSILNFLNVFLTKLTT